MEGSGTLAGSNSTVSVEADLPNAGPTTKLLLTLSTDSTLKKPAYGTPLLTSVSMKRPTSTDRSNVHVCVAARLPVCDTSAPARAPSPSKPKMLYVPYSVGPLTKLSDKLALRTGELAGMAAISNSRMDRRSEPN